MLTKGGIINHPISCFKKPIIEPSEIKYWRYKMIKVKKIFFAVKNLLKSAACNKSAASAKAYCNAFGTLALLALADALAEAAEHIIKKCKSQYVSC